MKGRSPWINLGLVGLAFVLYLAVMTATSGRSGEATTTGPPDPAILRITENVAAWEHAYDLQLTTVVVTEGVTSIGDNAFRDCMALRRIQLPATLENIGNAAFSGCDSLRIITYAGTVAEWQAIPKGKYWNTSVPAAEVICSDGREALVLN